jgi:hypothetical protein
VVKIDNIFVGSGEVFVFLGLGSHFLEGLIVPQSLENLFRLVKFSIKYGFVSFFISKFFNAFIDLILDSLAVLENLHLFSAVLAIDGVHLMDTSGEFLDLSGDGSLLLFNLFDEFLDGIHDLACFLMSRLECSLLKFGIVNLKLSNQICLVLNIFG